MITYKYSDVTPKETFLNRRELMLGAGSGAASIFLGSFAEAKTSYKKSKYSSELAPNSFSDITSYNNFYEFGTDKSDPQKHASSLKTDPWSVRVDGLTNKPGSYAFDQIMKDLTLEERIYPFRCVEGWSMVIPWIGFPLSDFIKKLEPLSNTKYVAFETLYRPEEMVGQNYNILKWPYREGLTIEEAMHPLTILVTGLYGQELPNQNGAPLRLIVPWKYGFKSIKSIVKIKFMNTEPKTSWNMQNPSEYGFYSNVNPNVDHPRWSQATERPIGSGLFAKRKKTLMFNGYAEEVSDLYKGMDLRKFY
jgi:sulfoxide reductase catalytic subunit YedY